jgi:hypothetical protein
LANLTFPVPVPIGDGSGPIVNISTSTRNKTIQIYGVFSGIIFIDGSCDGIAFNSVARFDLAGVQNLDDTILFVRIRRQFVADTTLIATACVACPDVASSSSVVTANQGSPGALPWPVTDAALDVALSTRASEATLALVKAKTDNLDVALSTRASEATLATRASEATLAALATIVATELDVPLSTRASEATLATRASEATLALIKAKTDNLDVALSTRASEATLATRASEATLALIKAKTDNIDVALSTRASEATLATRASEATLALIKAKTDNLDVALSTRASEATLATRASEATLALIKAKTDNLDVALSTRASEATLATRASEATLALIKAKTDNLDVALSTRASSANQTTLGAQTTKINDGVSTAGIVAATSSLNVAVIGTRLLTGSYYCGTGRIAGSAAAQNLASIENPAASGKTVYVKRSNVQGQVAVVSIVLFDYLFGRTAALPTLGTVLTSQKQSSSAPAPVAIVRSAPTAAAAAGNLWSVTAGNNGAAPGPFAPQLLEALSEKRETDDIVLAAGEALLMRAEANLATWSHQVNFAWDEG